MAKLPVCSGKEAVRAFERLGWTVARRKGSHVVLIKRGSFVTLSVPDHSTVAPGTLRSLLRTSNISVEKFVAALRGK